MKIIDFVKTNTQILSSSPIGIKIFNMDRDDTPCVFDSEEDKFSTFCHYCHYDIDRWYYFNNGTEKCYYLYIREVD